MSSPLQISPLFQQISSFLGIQSFGDEDLTARLEERMPLVRRLIEQFRDPNQTTFICVCIPEFLSMYETERLVQVSQTTLQHYSKFGAVICEW